MTIRKQYGQVSINYRQEGHQELEVDEAEKLSRAGHIVPVFVGSENTYYQNAAGYEFFCKDYPRAEVWPDDYTHNGAMQA